MNFKKAFAITLSLLIFANLVGLSSGASVPSLKEQAFGYISERYGVSIEHLSILNEGEATFSLTGQNLWAAKILDVETMRIYGVYMDTNGEIVNIETIKAKESEEYTTKYGKLEQVLFNRLQTTASDELIEVAIWLTSSNTHVRKPRSFTEDEYREFLASRREVYAVKQEPIVDFVTASGFQVIYRSRYAPLVFAKLPKSMITALESRLDIDMIYLSGICEAELDSIVPTVRANAVWNQGITGTGITVADVESGGGIEFQNPNLAVGSYYWPGDPRLSSHATAIAGIIESTHATYRGIAHGAPGILSGNARDWTYAELIAATEWAISNGASIVNYSWRDLNHQSLELGPLDRYVDHIVWDDWVTMVKSAGNNPQQSGNVTSPGLGYNIITVGSIDDHDNERWSDDEMSYFSSWRDPISTHNDREKPEVTAVGHRVHSTTTSSPWTGYVGAGTSYAAPNVAAGAALLMQTQPWLQWWPETVKAVLMASAVHNVEGDSRLSEYDGAGAVDLLAAYETASSNRIDGWAPTSDDFPITVTFSATKGQRIRVAIAWDSHPDAGHPPTTDPLESDLDLVIYDPDNSVAAYSMSFDNSYEIVDFLALEDGTYTARITAYRFDGSYEYVGFARCISPVWTREWYEVTHDGTTYTFTNYLGTTAVDNLYFANDWGEGTVAYGRGDYIGFRSFAPLYILGQDPLGIGITTDDGVRFWVDEELLLDKWFLQSPTNYGVTFTPGLIGTYNLRLDWFEWTGLAVIKFRSNVHPSTPSRPSGPTSGYRNLGYTYSTSTTDPDGDDVRYEFEFSGPIPTVSFMTGWYASGETGSLTVMWETTDPPGTYYVRARAQDVYEQWSDWSPSLTVYIYNRAPNTPSKPSGPTSGYRSVSYTYSTSTTDPDGDNVRYQFDWGDCSTTTTGWYASGSTASASHSWGSTGTYYVKVRAEDSYGAWSGWSSSLTVSISSGGGGGCPILYVYDGSEYVCEGLLDIHNPDGTDVTTDHTLVTTPKTVRSTYRLRLVEHPQTISHIDQVKLYAILPDETLIELLLVGAWHSEYRNVLPQLLSSDDWKTETLGADHNNGVSQSIELRFAALPQKLNAIGFVFQIEGNNMYYKVMY